MPGDLASGYEPVTCRPVTTGYDQGMSPSHRLVFLLLLACGLAATESAWWTAHAHVHPLVPVMRTPADATISVESVAVELDAKDQLVRTVMTVQVRNRGPTSAEAVLLLPLPAGAAVRSFGFSGPGGELEARLLPADEARSIYQAIVSTMRDPALLEFAGAQLLRSSVFPVEPGRTQAVRLSFEQVLELRDGRLEWILPRAEALAGVAPWTIRARLAASVPIGAVFAPMQRFAETSRDGRAVELRLDGAADPGAIRLSWCLRGAAPLSVVAFPEGDGGVFAVLAEAPPAGSAAPIPLEVTVLIDRSGSMAGDKWTQSRAAVAQVLAALGSEETANVLLFNEGVDPFARTPLAMNEAGQQGLRRWLEAARPSGGTNLYDGLAAALGQPLNPGTLPLILLISDGLPTLGITSELAIRQRAGENPAGRRLFCVGVGHDANAPLLDHLAEAGRGRARHLPPGADIELAVAELVKALGRPVLAAPELIAEAGRVLDRQPRHLRDAFAGEQILVTGRYAGRAPVRIELAGTLADGARWQRSAVLDPGAADPFASWVARLWAQRRIAELVEQARDLGADGRTVPDRLNELTADIVRLSTQYGILTEYTAFLATEGAPLPPAGPMPLSRAERDRWDAAAAPTLKRAAAELQNKGLAPRAGAQAQASSINNERLRETVQAAADNRILDADGQTQAYLGVQQAASSSLWRRNGRWVEVGADGAPARRIAFASAEHLALAERLAGAGRQALLANDGEIQLRDGGEILLIEAAR